MSNIDYKPLANCKSMKLNYGEICIQCNKCGRFNKKENDKNE